VQIFYVRLAQKVPASQLLINALAGWFEPARVIDNAFRQHPALAFESLGERFGAAVLEAFGLSPRRVQT
jgi:hypothetical protein